MNYSSLSKINDQGSGVKDQDQGSGSGSKIKDQGSRIKDQGSRIRDQGSESRIRIRIRIKDFFKVVLSFTLLIVIV